MFCRKCGNTIPVDSVFCPYCGAPIATKPKTIVNVKIAEPEAAKPAEPKDNVPDFDSDTLDILDTLHRKVSAVVKKSGYNLIDIYGLNAAEDDCKKIKSYDNGDFIANDCLADYYINNLGANDYFADYFDSAIECMQLALKRCPPDQRQKYAEEYYFIKLLASAEKVIENLRNYYYETVGRGFIKDTMRKDYLRENADRDAAVYLSLTKLPRIPCLSERFLDKMTKAILGCYRTGDSHQVSVWIKSQLTKETWFENLYNNELKKNYPEYAQRKGI